MAGHRLGLGKCVYSVSFHNWQGPEEREKLKARVQGHGMK
jgi:hypothetical protein